jgi:hypothetical protein
MIRSVRDRHILNEFSQVYMIVRHLRHNDCKATKYSYLYSKYLFSLLPRQTFPFV